MIYTHEMRTSFTLKGRYSVSPRQMELFLQGKFYEKPYQEKIRIVEGLPTVGVLHNSRNGIFTYFDDAQQVVTTIIYKWGSLYVTVVGGNEEDKQAWKVLLRTFRLGPTPKRGRPSLAPKHVTKTN